ncbi:U2 small nuclear ribonucleoprotein Aprime [Diplonema papillatum]|nr:U2 small nuclear ribonucleoprotein Aprime [Diplonema papillatum]
MWASGGSPYPSAAGGGGAGPRPYWSRPELHGRAEPALESVRFTETSVSAVNVGLTSLDQLRDRVPEDVRRKVVSVDVSMNYLSDLQAVAALFPSLKHLVADGNRIHRLGNFLGGSLPDLETLWLNKNSVTDLSSAMSDLRGSASLKYLSLLGNPCCSHAVGLGQGGAAAAAGAGDWGAGETELYRAFVAHHLPSLRFLDESPVEGRDRLFFSGAELEYAYVWVRLKQTGWCKAAMAVVGNADGDGEIRVWSTNSNFCRVWILTRAMYTQNTLYQSFSWRPFKYGRAHLGVIFFGLRTFLNCESDFFILALRGASKLDI